MKRKISKYVYTATSFDGQYNLLFNSKNDYFIRYDNQDFKDIIALTENEEICEFLSEKGFYYSDDEFQIIQKTPASALKSEDTLMLILKITKDCNFRCTYCYEDFSSTKMSDDIQNNVINLIKKQLKIGKIKHVIVSWFGGEPLLNLQCIEDMSPKIINLCLNYGAKYSSSIVTNGYLLNSHAITKLLNAKVNNFQITIDGPSYVHNKQRKSIDGKGTYDEIKNNLLNFKDIKGHFNVILRTNISRDLLACMNDYEDDLLIKFIDDSRFLTMYHPVVDFSDCSHLVTDDEIINLITHALKKDIRFAPLTEYLSSTNSFCYGIKENRYVIDVDGQVSKCTVVNEPYSIIGNVTPEGIIDTNAFNNLWKCARISSKCIECDSYASCGGGACPLFYLKHGQARCMKYKNPKQKELILKITELQKGYHLTLHLK